MSLKKYMNSYEFETTLPGNGQKIKYKGISTNTLKKLLMYEDEKDPIAIEKVLDDIIETSVINEGFDIDSLYNLDRYYLFTRIRIASKGSIYEVRYSCKKCKSQNLERIDLEDVFIKKPKKINNKIKLSNDQIEMTLDWPTRGKQKEYYDIVSQMDIKHEKLKLVEMGLADTASYVTKIITPDGEEEIDKQELIEWIGDLPDTAKEVFDEWIEKNNFGINLKHIFKCKGCGKETEDNLPMQDFFF